MYQKLLVDQSEPPGSISTGLVSGSVEGPLQPLLKWPGGKRTLAEKIIGSFPRHFERYFEPFVGGGAVFFALRPRTAFLADVNDELINCYRVVKEEPDALLRVLRTLKNSEEAYYRVRSSQPRTSVRRAARLLYLTRLSFNGIHRVNLAGKFNVPYGQKTHLTSFDETAVLRTSEALRSVTLLCADFEEATKDARAGDLIYFDPPYTVAHANNGFLKYNEHIFSWADQCRLAAAAQRLGSKGCTVVVSNAAHPSLRALYRGVRVQTFERYSVISASSEHRRRISELLFILGRVEDA